MGVVVYQMDPAHMHWASPLVSFLCMWVKMNISATFVVAYIQVKSPNSVRIIPI